MAGTASVCCTKAPSYCHGRRGLTRRQLDAQVQMLRQHLALPPLSASPAMPSPSMPTPHMPMPMPPGQSYMLPSHYSFPPPMIIGGTRERDEPEIEPMPAAKRPSLSSDVSSPSTAGARMSLSGFLLNPDNGNEPKRQSGGPREGLQLDVVLNGAVPEAAARRFFNRCASVSPVFVSVPALIDSAATPSAQTLHNLAFGMKD